MKCTVRKDNPCTEAFTSLIAATLKIKICSNGSKIFPFKSNIQFSKDTVKEYSIFSFLILQKEWTKKKEILK